MRYDDDVGYIEGNLKAKLDKYFVSSIIIVARVNGGVEKISLLQNCFELYFFCL